MTTEKIEDTKPEDTVHAREHELAGKVVTAVRVREDLEFIVFDTIDGPIHFRCDAEGKAHTKIVRVDNLDSLIGHRVIGVYYEDLDDEETKTHWFYSLTIATGAGKCRIVYKNNDEQKGACALFFVDPEDAEEEMDEYDFENVADWDYTPD